ncbi:signal peptidase I [Candidatus Roizmanbacteria bacterium]|nr:signal peptidase I [Candidatus Roizmanbacteria bacterium]
MKIFKSVFNLLSWVFIGLFILLVVFTVGSNTNILGGYKSYLVQSGSMEPTIMIGDIIIDHKPTQYVKNDVITFVDKEQRIVTHRIIGVSAGNNELQITTKGDANRAEDGDQIGEKNIIGKVIFIVPKLGYLVAFTKSLPGFILLVLGPIAIIIFDEITKVFSKNA